jgi:hypothetical protein
MYHIDVKYQDWSPDPEHKYVKRTVITLLRIVFAAGRLAIFV